MREIPPYYLICGIKNIDLRKDIEDEIRRQKLKIKEIRFREIGFALRDKRKVDTKKIKIKTTKYKSSGGTEYFLQAVNKDNILFGLLRLRLEKNNSEATIRELQWNLQELLTEYVDITSKGKRLRDKVHLT